MITRNDAGTALKDVEDVMDRTTRAMGYKAASPHLLLWGIIWILGYGANAAGLFAANLHWPALVAIGVLTSSLIGARESRQTRGVTDWRPPMTLAVIAAFVFALFTVLPPQSGNQVGTFFPLLVSLAYVILAIWTGGVRIGLVGLLLGGASLYAYHFQPGHFDILMAVIGGGGLLLGGLWLRRL